MMTKLYLAVLILLSGCSNPVACIDGKLYSNVDPLGAGDIYVATNTECKEVR